MLAYSFIVGEEKQSVLCDRTTEGSAKNVLGIFRNRTVRQSIHPLVGVEILVLQQIVGGAVKAVGPRLEDRDNLAAIGVSIGRVTVGRDHLQFVDCVRCRVVSDQVVLRFVILRAFEQEVISLLPVSVDRRYAAV